ncbi:MAG TPA: PAS domain-containing protein, partial [Planctomycetota bacterium]|nr:PAS domain-containing protein [Planctomycetota bacterium]
MGSESVEDLPPLLGEEGSESKLLLEQVQALARVGFFESGIGGPLRWSRETYRMFGIPPGTPVTFDSFVDFVHPEDRARILDVRARLYTGPGVVESEHRIVRPGGEVRWIFTRMAVLRDADDKPERVIGIVQDVTARHHASTTLRSTEEQLRVAQKLEAIGRLAGGVAHDFNNLLTIILSLCSVLGRRLPPDAASARDDLAEIQGAAERAAALTRQLLAFGRKQVLKPRLVHLGLTVLEMEPMLRRLVAEDVTLVLDATPSLP